MIVAAMASKTYDRCAMKSSPEKLCVRPGVRWRGRMYRRCSLQTAVDGQNCHLGPVSLIIRSLVVMTALTLAAWCLPSSASQAQTRPARASELVFTAVGDLGDGPEAGATLDLAARSKANFHLALGDLAYSAAPETSWCAFVTRRVGPRVPFLLLAGNHEDDSGGEGHIGRFAQCLPDRVGVIGTYGVEYYFDHGRLARFIMISPDLTVDGVHYYYGRETARYAWLARTIDEARASGIPWVIVGMHKSCLSMAQYYCRIYADLMNLLVERKVDLVLQGHDHSYQRTRQIALGSGCPEVAIDAFNAACVADRHDSEYRKGGGTIQVIVGTGGRPLYDVNVTDSEAGYFARWMGGNAQPRNGLLRVTVSPRELRAEFLGSTRTSDFTDAFSIRARD
jgi:hypothetical protein